VRAAGFTLVELMVVVSIIAILAGIAASFMRTPRDEKALRASTNALTALIAQSRNRAMSTGRAVIMRIESHEPWPDLITGADVGLGSGLSQIEIFDSTSAVCGDREAATLIPARVLDPENPELPYRHAVVTRVAPADADGAVEVCFTPTGRVVDPLTGRPVLNIGTSTFGGRILVEMRPVGCTGGQCTVRPDRTTLSLGFNGLTEMLPADFDLGAL
jgi:prepilin-type N-terminal cleavage/methylation domain-containing protein